MCRVSIQLLFCIFRCFIPHVWFLDSASASVALKSKRAIATPGFRCLINFSLEGVLLQGEKVSFESHGDSHFQDSCSSTASGIYAQHFQEYALWDAVDFLVCCIPAPQSQLPHSLQ